MPKMQTTPFSKDTPLEDISEIKALIDERIDAIAEQDGIIETAIETKTTLRAELVNLQDAGRVQLNIKETKVEEPSPTPTQTP
jgi:hypothetical protein